jgi:hypothetical protein
LLRVSRRLLRNLLNHRVVGVSRRLRRVSRRLLRNLLNHQVVGVSRRLLGNLLNHRVVGVSRRLLGNLLNHRVVGFRDGCCAASSTIRGDQHPVSLAENSPGRTGVRVALG